MCQDRAKPNPRGRGCSWNGTQEYTDGVLVSVGSAPNRRSPVCSSPGLSERGPAVVGTRGRHGTERNLPCGSARVCRIGVHSSFTPRVLFAAAARCTNLNVGSVPNQAQEYTTSVCPVGVTKLTKKAIRLFLDVITTWERQRCELEQSSENLSNVDMDSALTGTGHKTTSERTSDHHLLSTNNKQKQLTRTIIFSAFFCY